MDGRARKVYSDEHDLSERVEDRNAVQKYQDLRVYKLAFDSAMKIFDVSKSWPPEERYSLTDQIRRSSRSVCGNIAKAWRKRRYPAHFVSKLSDADTEAAETEVWLHFALVCGYLDNQKYLELKVYFDHICGMLVRMMSQADEWCKS